MIWLLLAGQLALSEAVHQDRRVEGTLEGDDLLRAPGKLDAAIAKTAPRVDVLVIPDLPDGGRGTLWSSWGDGCVASNGKYYTSVGDHRGMDGTSRVYEYDPASKSLQLLVDVAKVQKGHGKIHAGIHEHDGALWFATYWGKPREMDFTGEYQGSILLRLEPASGKVENLGAIVPKRGLPASNFDPARGLLYFHAVTTDGGDLQDSLAVYDVKARRVICSAGGNMTGKRAFLRDLAGRVYFSCRDGTLGVYGPDQGATAATKIRLPEGASLRAGAAALKSGPLFGMTGAGRLFSLDPRTEEVKDLGPNLADGDYTAVMASSPDGKWVYFVPGAHGSSSRHGTPVVQVDTATGRRKVLAFLHAPVREKLKHHLGGTYSLQVDAAGERLFITFNGAPVSGGKQEAFGQPSIVVVHIPASER